MKHIKLIPYYLKTMVEDIKAFEVVEKAFKKYMSYSMLFLIGAIMFFILFKNSSGMYKENYFLLMLISILTTFGWIYIWILVYFGAFFYTIREIYEETRMQRQHPYLYSRFMKESD